MPATFLVCFLISFTLYIKTFSLLLFWLLFKREPSNRTTEAKLKLSFIVIIKNTETWESKRGFVIQMFTYTYVFYQKGDKKCSKIIVKLVRAKRVCVRIYHTMTTYNMPTTVAKTLKCAPLIDGHGYA